MSRYEILYDDRKGNLKVCPVSSNLSADSIVERFEVKHSVTVLQVSPEVSETLEA